MTPEQEHEMDRKGFPEELQTFFRQINDTPGAAQFFVSLPEVNHVLQSVREAPSSYRPHGGSQSHSHMPPGDGTSGYQARLGGPAAKRS